MTDRATLLLHPVRLRIVQALSGRSLDMTSLQQRLPDLPTSSLYRHVGALRAAGLVLPGPDAPRARDQRFSLSGSTRLTAAELSGRSAAEHHQHFTTWVATLLSRYGAYLDAAEAAGGVDLGADRVGWTERSFFATEAEFDAIAAEVEAVFARAAAVPAGPGRRRRRLATLTFPED
jgi:DNA-binding transcriptional ArsR family regulator